MELLEDNYLWVYAALILWLVIAMILSYLETKKNHGRFILGSFISLTFDKTVMLAFTILSIFSDSNGSSSNSDKTITKVRFRNGYATVYYEYGDRHGSFSVACTELVSWTAQTVTVKVKASGQNLVNTMNPSGAVIDTYFE